MKLIALLILLMMPPQDEGASDPDSQSKPSRRDFGFKVFKDLDRPIAGLWSLEISGLPARRIEIREQVPGNPAALVGIDTEGEEELFRLAAKKEGIGYQGTLGSLFTVCGLETLPVTEFLPLGDSIVLKFEASPTILPCPPIDSGEVGRFVAVSTGGAPIKLRDFSEISSSSAREAYSIGGERSDAEVSYRVPIDAVSIDPGSELKFMQRLKAPLDGSYWFEMEVVLAPGTGVEPPRGYVTASALQFVGSLTLKRAKEE